MDLEMKIMPEVANPRTNIDQLRAALKKAWSRETSADPDRWHPGNPSWGQCAVTSLVVQDYFGGALCRGTSTKANGSHYWVAHPKEGVLDMTIQQFNGLGTGDFIGDMIMRTREYVLSYPATRERYKMLRLALERELNGNNSLFDDELYIRCLRNALDSDCEKGKYGCVLVTAADGRIIADGFNQKMEPLKDWCEPTCMRRSIPSRTESMLGACAHAEERAIVAAMRAGIDLALCRLYVAGMRSNGAAYIKDEPVFTCIRCATQAYMRGLAEFAVPTGNGWGHISAARAIETAKKYATQEKRI